MASQVLSGSSNPTYTNNTGQNVRLVLNVLENIASMTWNNVTTDFVSTAANKIGNSAFGGTSDLNLITPLNFTLSPPYQLSLAPGQSFSAVCDNYNIIVIKEDGS